MGIYPLVLDGVDYNAMGSYNALAFTGTYVTPPHLAGVNSFRLGKIGGNRWVFVDHLGKVNWPRCVFHVTTGYSDSNGAMPTAPRYLHGTVPPTVPVSGDEGQHGRTHIFTTNTKYAGAGTTWTNATFNRLQRFHFNATAPADSVNGNQIMVEQLHTTASQYGKYKPFVTADSGGALTSAIKDIFFNLPPNPPGNVDLAYRPGDGAQTAVGWGDWLDPNYAVWITQYSGYAPGHSFGGLSGPFTLGWTFEESDFISKVFNAGVPNETGLTVAGGNWGPHAGMLILMSKPTVTSQYSGRDGLSYTYPDTTNYSKLKLINNLKAKYGTIANLNAAWGTNNYYTTFDSLGQWGNTASTSLMDENGMGTNRTWLGCGSPVLNPGHPQSNQVNVIDSTTWGLNGTTTPSTFYIGQTVRHVKQDLDQILYESAVAWIKPWSDMMRARDPGVLLTHCNNGGHGNNGGVSRMPLLLAITPYVDYLTGGAHVPTGETPPTLAQVKAQMDLTYSVMGKPFLLSCYAPAGNVDGCLYFTPNFVRSRTATAQYIYDRMHNPTTGALHYRALNGDWPYVGLHFWNLYDQTNENVSWSILSRNDNPYDGRDYRAVSQGGPGRITDPWTPDRTTFTEDRVYTDFLGYGGTTTLLREDLMVGANKAVLAALQSQITQTVAVSDFTWSQPLGQQAIVFTDTSSGNPSPTAWTWNFGDGTPLLSGNDPAVHKSPTHTYSAPGTYNVIHTATNTLGTGTTTKQVTVIAPQAGFAYKSLTTNQVGAVTTVTVSVPSIAVGDLIVVMLDANAPSPANFTVADALGHTYTPLSDVFDWGARMRSFWTVATVGGSNVAVTGTSSGTPVSFFFGAVYVASVVGGTPAINLIAENHAVGPPGSASPLSSGSINATGLALLIGFAGKAGVTVTVGTPFELIPTSSHVLAHALNVSPGTYAYTGTYAGTTSWGAQILAFRPTVGGTADTVNTTPALIPWTGQPLNLAGIEALAAMALTWTGVDLDIQTPVTTTVVTTDPASMTWTGQVVLTPGLRVRATLTLDFFNRQDGPLT